MYKYDKVQQAIERFSAKKTKKVTEEEILELSEEPYESR